VSHPISYQYNYTYKGNDWTSTFSGEYFTATALGDVDGDNAQSKFLRGGMLSDSGQLVLNTLVYKENETE
jgi:hypothetical protein